MDSAWLIIFSSILFSAFFAGMEIAFISANKLLIELRYKQGSITAAVLSNFVNHPSKFISTTLVGNNIGLVVYGIYMAKVLEPVFIAAIPHIESSRFLMLFLQTIVSTLLVLVMGEFLPKVLFRINPDVMLNVLALPFLLFYYLFWPLVHFIIWLSKIILDKVLRIKYVENTPVFSKLDLDHYIDQVSDSDLDEDAEVDTEIFRNALDFSNIRVRDCMTPRTELISIDVNAPIEDVYKRFVETGLSKLLVYGGSPDNIIGYVHQKEIFTKPRSLKQILIPIEIAMETVQVIDLLNKFSRKRKSIALVVDELGSTSGVITTEDIMEEIFGEIEDEHDVEVLVEEVINENEYRFSARHEIFYLNNRYDLNLPEGEYQTLGGFIFNRFEDIPKKGQRITFDNFEITIEEASNSNIGVVRLKIHKDERK